MEETHRTALRARLAQIVGAAGVLTEPADMAPYLVDERARYRGATPAVVRPSSTEEVARVVALCAAEKIPIVPQGGNTGLCGAATPDASGRELVVSLARLNRVRDIDPLNYTITVEAGVILADVQKAAAEADRLFPLSLGGEGTARIGGNLSTNAGGTGVLRYGNARDLALGLEVVLPDGRVWDGLSALRKDNTGYDLKHLFIGAEGTLGIITAAVLKLFPPPAGGRDRARRARRSGRRGRPAGPRAGGDRRPGDGVRAHPPLALRDGDRRGLRHPRPVRRAPPVLRAGRAVGRRRAGRRARPDGIAARRGDG